MNSKIDLFATKLNQYFVAHIDILGFQDRINNTKEIEIEKEGIKLDEFFIEILHGFSGNPIRAISYSDNMCISTKAEHSYDLESFISFMALFQLKLIDKNRYAIRGGISWGPHFQTERTIFSPAYIKAYKLENTYSIFPRIIIDNEIINNYIDWYARGLQRNGPSLHSMILRDGDDSFYFIDYLYASALSLIHKLVRNSALDQIIKLMTGIEIQFIMHRNWVIEQLSKQSNKRIIDKYKWLSKYHNQAIDNYFNKLLPDLRYVIELNSDIESTISTHLVSLTQGQFRVEAVSHFFRNPLDGPGI